MAKPDRKPAWLPSFRLILTAAAFSLCWLLTAAGPALALELTNVVLFARFAGETEADVFNAAGNWAQIDALYTNNYTQNAVYGSLVDDSFPAYIKAISNGQLTVKVVFPQESPDGSSVNVFQLSKNSSGYGDDDGQVVQELLTAINEGRISLPDGITPDQREQGVLDNLTVIIQGDGENINADPILYPHRNTYAGAEHITAQGWNCLVRNFNMIDSASLLGGTRGQGVVSHEFLHSVGFSDLYRYSGGGQPVGPWDLMSQAGRWQPYPLAYTRAQQGWLALTTVTPAEGLSQTLTLDLATLSSGQRGIVLKTPFSDTEFFVLEYRRKLSWGGSMKYGFDTKLTDEGLLIYRVNTTVGGQGNQSGEDFLYIFRPNETSLTAAGGEINNAALTPWGSEAADGYGSADLQAPFTENTIFYSDGRNSGIVLSQLSAGPNGAASDQLTMTVTFPDYSQLDIWNKVGADATTGCTSTSLAFHPDGRPYLAGEKNNGIYVGFYADGLWTALPSPGAGLYPQLGFLGETPVLLYLDDSWARVWLKAWDGNAWQTKASYTTDYQFYLGLAGDGEKLCFFYLPDGNTLQLNTLTADGVEEGQALTIPTGGSLIAPALTLFQGEPVLAYAYMDSNWKFSKTQICHLTSQGWQTLHSGSTTSNMHSVAAWEDRLYVLAGDNSIRPTLYSWDGSAWAEEQPLDTTSYTSVSVTADAGGAVLGLVENVWQTGITQAVPVARVYTQEAGSWALLAGDVCNYTAELALSAQNGVLYAAIAANESGGSSLKLYRHDLPGDKFQIQVSDSSAKVAIRSTQPLHGQLVIAYYSQGRLLRTQLQQIDLGAGSYTWPTNLAEGEEIRAFLLDDTLSPLLTAACWGE